MNQPRTIPDGQRTKTIYTLIKDGKYQDVYIYLFRPLIISIINFNFVLEVDQCRSLLIVIS
jgi:hypothetical protein